LSFLIDLRFFEPRKGQFFWLWLKKPQKSSKRIKKAQRSSKQLKKAQNGSKKLKRFKLTNPEYILKGYFRYYRAVGIKWHKSGVNRSKMA
jgi:hypothetical protein